MRMRFLDIVLGCLVALFGLIAVVFVMLADWIEELSDLNQNNFRTKPTGQGQACQGTGDEVKAK